jgi:hypothetical protein
MSLVFFSCKKEIIYKGYYQFTMDIGYYFEGEYFDYSPGPVSDSFNLILRQLDEDRLVFVHSIATNTSSFEQEVFLSVDKKNNIAGSWTILGVGGPYFLSGKIVEFHEHGKIEGTVSIATTHDVPPLSLELETSVTAFGPFVLEKID